MKYFGLVNLSLKTQFSSMGTKFKNKGIYYRAELQEGSCFGSSFSYGAYGMEGLNREVDTMGQ